MTTLVLGPSLGTSATALWGACAALLADEADLVLWDLPGHGSDRGPAPTPLTVQVLAARVLDLVEGPFAYAGDSVGGAVGLQLALDAPERVESLTLLCTGARIGSPEGWLERVGLVGRSGTSGMVEASARRWFGSGFLEREPARGSALLHSLADTDDAGYIAVCQALARFDVTARLEEITCPVLAVAGSEDEVTPVAGLRQIADGVPDGRLVVLDGVAHLAPAERPDEVARLIRDHSLTTTRRPT